MAGTVVSHTKNGKVYLGFLEENSKSWKFWVSRILFRSMKKRSRLLSEKCYEMCPHDLKFYFKIFTMYLHIIVGVTSSVV
jgi:hypothetical protein